MSIILIINSFVSISICFYWQLNIGDTPMWLIALYYCSWVGVGGRIMGAAYALAHKEVCDLTNTVFELTFILEVGINFIYLGS
jgi:hypothetical protein